MARHNVQGGGEGGRSGEPNQMGEGGGGGSMGWARGRVWLPQGVGGVHQRWGMGEGGNVKTVSLSCSGVGYNGNNRGRVGAGKVVQSGGVPWVMVTCQGPPSPSCPWELNQLFKLFLPN